MQIYVGIDWEIVLQLLFVIGVGYYAPQITFLWVLHNLSRVFNGQESYFTIWKKKKNSGLAPLNSVSQRYVTLRRSKVLTLNFGFFQKSVIFLNNAQKYCYKPSL